MRFIFALVGAYLVIMLALSTFVALTTSLFAPSVPLGSGSAVNQAEGNRLPTGLSLSMPYVRLAWDDAVQAGIAPATFVRQINQESGFRPQALSPAGAQGIAQFLPSTASALGVDPWNPVSALSGAARYMARLIQSYHGDAAKALAAYNAGSAAVNRCVQRGQRAWLSCLPIETRDYVRIILM
jgi:soluble lytic murein transglycosylase-like protein